MKDPNLTLLEAAVRLLDPLLDELVFAGRLDPREREPELKRP